MTVILSNKVDDREPWDGFMLLNAQVSTSSKADDSAAWEFLTRIAQNDHDSAFRYWPYPLPGGVLAKYRNKCRDSSTLQWVEWVTDYEDIYGTEYPSAGFDPGTYRVINITYDQGQG